MATVDATDEDEALLDALLEKLDADGSLRDNVQLLIYAAFEGDETLNDAIAGSGKSRPERSTSSERAAAEPVGAYLRRVTVTGFRGVGQTASLTLSPGPGLTVVSGRNGSGKSSFAEAVEFVLSGKNDRWDGRTTEWRSGWRNLHFDGRTNLEVELVVEGANPAVTTVRHRWAPGADIDAGTVDVLQSGQSPEPLSTLGWGQALTTFRPFLSYNELGRALTGRQSDLYDALASILGLDRIKATHDRVKATHLLLKKSTDDAKARARDLTDRASTVTDSRAERLVGLLRARRWDLAALASLVTPEADDDADLAVLHALTRITTPDPHECQRAAAALRDAVAALDGLRGTDAERCALDAELLEHALSRHGAIGDGPCPVCGVGTLDAEWHQRATARARELRQAATEAAAARGALRSALRTARGLLASVPDVLDRLDDVGLTLADDPRTRWQRFLDAPADPAPFADHLDATGPPLAAAIGELVEAARAESSAREDRWRPLARDLAGWIDDARAVEDRAPVLADLAKAAAWLKTTSEDWANARLAPLSDESARIWERLRQESNVALGPVVLAGTATRRRVRLDVTVDDAPGSALGVMSQGELHALALSLFLPRATVPHSPFRFLVIDDPVQAMDPAKVDGLAEVLADVARRRQVLVFTHDDRLPSAIRRMRLPATLLEVTRREGSVVQVVKAEDPASRHLRDALALTSDDSVPAAVAARIVPGLSRLAIDAVCVDRIRAQRLANGVPHADVEDLIERCPKLYPRMALALFDDEKRAGDVLTRLNRTWGPWAASTFRECNEGAHGGPTVADLRDLVSRTRDLVARLQS